MSRGPVLICYDGSVHARRAIHAAAEILGPRPAVVLDVEPVLTPTETYYVMASAATGAEFERLNAAEGLARATEGADIASAAGFAATPRGAVAGTARDGILEVADEIDASVIVVGSHGRTGVRERLEGSVSHELTQHSSRPVLVVPPPRHR